MPSNTKVQEFRIEVIKETLNIYKKNNQPFDNITMLAKTLSQVITDKEKIKWMEEPSFFTNKPKKMAHQTLLTNKKYKTYLAKYLNVSSDKNINDELLFSKDLEISEVVGNVCLF